MVYLYLGINRSAENIVKFFYPTFKEIKRDGRFFIDAYYAFRMLFIGNHAFASTSLLID